MDKTSYFFTFQCGICHPGGAATQYDRQGNKYYDRATGRFGFGDGTLTALPTSARLDGDYGFINPQTGIPGLAPWSKNGVLEADCLMCHLNTTGPRADGTRNYWWKGRTATMIGGAALAGVAAFEVAPTAGAGWANITFCNPATTACGTPFPKAEAVAVNYESGLTAATLVESSDAACGGSPCLAIPLGRVAGTPESNCRGCHSTPDTKKSGRTLLDETDVHKRSGVGCTACHPNSGNALEHQIGKGDVVIGSVRDDLDNTALSCADCHLDGQAPAPLVAPDPTVAHRSIPGLHFQAMQCQVCHIRYLEDDPATAGMQVPELIIEMTSTGTQTISTWDKYFRTDPLDPTQNDPALAALTPAAPYRWYPGIRYYKGKLTTVKPLVTSYYGDWLTGTGDGAIIRPIPLRMVRKALGNAYATGTPRLAGLTITPGGLDPANPIPYRRADIKALLEAMAAATDTVNPDPAANNDIVIRPVIVRAEKIYYLDDLGEVAFFESAVAETHDFSVNHNVVAKRDVANPVLRPGPYGAGGCADCHSPSSSFFFGKQLAEPAQYEFLDEAGLQVNPAQGTPAYRPHWEAMGYTEFKVASLTGGRVAVNLQVGGWGPGSRVTGTGIDCGFADGVCYTTVAEDGDLVLTAHPGVGVAVKSWMGCTPSADLLTCTIAVGQLGPLGGARVVAVTFGQPDPTPAPTVSGIQLDVVGTGWGTVTGSGLSCNLGTQGACNAEIANGTAVTLTATPGPNSWLVEWQGCTPVAGDPTQCTVSIAGIMDVRALFSNGSGGGVYSPTQRLTTVPYGVRPGNRIFGGPIDCTSVTTTGSCKADIATGGTVTLQAVAGSGSTFVRWEGCTSVSGGVCSVTLDVPVVVFAVFSP